MNYVFVCPGMPFNGDTIALGESLGGSESACYYVARGVAALGHRALVMTNDQEAQGQHDGVDYAWCGPQSQRFPVGEYAHQMMENAQNDVLVVQRASGIHHIQPTAKVALWWLHDLALLRSAGAVRGDLFNYDGILAVSSWHRKQIADVYELDQHKIWALPNSVDKTLYDPSAHVQPMKGELRMLYQSRPERGIDYLIAPGGIMDQLSTAQPGIHLYVCGYDNYPPHMQGYYENVRNRIEESQNCTWLGHLSKADLAKQQVQCDLMIYPGEFEETSCISAMEAQTAGLPFLGSATGALPETCKGGGAHLIKLRDNRCDVREFVQFAATTNKTQLENMRRLQLRKASEWSWDHSAKLLADLVEDQMRAKRANTFSMLRTMLDRSDVLLARKYRHEVLDAEDMVATAAPRKELDEAYKFTLDFEEHYDSDHAVADIERGGDSLDISQNLRFRESATWLTREAPARILDYGCQKGHYIFSLAHKYREAEYVGIDISPRVIEWAKANCRVDGADIKFYAADIMKEDFPFDEIGKFDAIMLGEMLEHTDQPNKLLDRLSLLMNPQCRIVVTTPYGEWEGKDYNARPKMERYHLHHFERDDLDDMFRHHREYITTAVPAGRCDRGTLGSWVTTFVFEEGSILSKQIDFERKLKNYVARETLSYCAIVKNAESTILRSLLTLNDVVDEFIIGLDRNTSDGTRAVLEKFRDDFAGYRRFEIVDADSPLDIGFDEARNRTVEQARGDWILWLDADEDLINPGNLVKYLKNNMYDGYGVAQHHVSVQPVGVLTVDWPVRLFRNRDYLRFQGVVHEHPDDIENPNRGPRRPAQLLDFHIVHHGYTTEPVRRARFARNLPLIKKDRVQHPDRVLGRLLWLRDLSHMVMFELEQTQGRPTAQAMDYARQGLKEWEDLLELRGSPVVDRMIRDGLEFYSNLVRVTGQGFEVDFKLNIVRGAHADFNKSQRRQGCFMNREHLDKYMALCIDEQTKGFDSKYF